VVKELAEPLPERVQGTVRLPTDEEGHPYGQWSAVLEKTETNGVYRLRALVEGALAGVSGGDILTFYRAPKKLAVLIAV